MLNIYCKLVIMFLRIYLDYENERTRLSCFNVKTMLLKVKISYFKLSKIILVRLVRLDWIGWFSYVRLFRLA